MFDFYELIERSIAFNLHAIALAEKEAFENLKISSATSDIKALQIVSLQKYIISIGMFSMFEAMLQKQLNLTEKEGFLPSIRYRNYCRKMKMYRLSQLLII